MAAPSRPPTFKAYACKPVCLGCGRKLSYDEPVWFVGWVGAFCFERACRQKAAKA